MHGVQSAGQAAEQASNDESDDFGVVNVHAQGHGRSLIVADGSQRPAPLGAADTFHNDAQHHQKYYQEIKPMVVT